MSYTKGPYKRHFWVVFDNDGNKLADFDLSVENAQLDPQTVIDNANLFVAGPELVEALEAIMARIHGEFDHPSLVKHGPLSIGQDGDILDIAQKALTKAKGGQP